MGLMLDRGLRRISRLWVISLTEYEDTHSCKQPNALFILGKSIVMGCFDSSFFLTVP